MTSENSVGTIDSGRMNPGHQNLPVITYSFPILPKMIHVETFLRNSAKYKWEEMKTQLNLKHGLQSPILVPFSIVIENLNLEEIDDGEPVNQDEDGDDPSNEFNIDQDVFGKGSESSGDESTTDDDDENHYFDDNESDKEFDIGNEKYCHENRNDY